MTKRDTQRVNKILSSIGKLFNQINGSTLRQLESNQALAQHIETFNNTFVRKGESRITNSKAHAAKLIKWIGAKYQKEIDARKTEKG